MLDLGEEWFNLTGLPFVYACWITGKRSEVAHIEKILSDVREKNLADIERIVSKCTEDSSLPADVIHNYLTENITFTLGDDELHGLNRFGRYLFDLGQVPGLRELKMEGL